MRRKQIANTGNKLTWLPASIGIGLLLLIADIVLERWLPESVVVGVILTALLLWVSMGLFWAYFKSKRFWIVAVPLLLAHFGIVTVATMKGALTFRADSFILFLVTEAFAIAMVVNLVMRKL